MAGPMPIWTCRWCEGRFRLPPTLQLDRRAAVRCPACGRVNPPRPPAAPRTPEWTRLASWGVGSLVLSLLTLTLGVQLTRLLLLPDPGPAPTAEAAAVPSADEEPDLKPDERIALSTAGELYEAGLYPEVGAALEELAAPRSPEAHKLHSRALRRAGRWDAARRAHQEYRLARAAGHSHEDVQQAETMRRP